jgi:hypothetical protein
MLAAELRRPLGSLLVLSDDLDPYIADRPGRRRDGAEWFAELWIRLSVPDGVHLRRLHYLLVSTAGTIMPTGRPYLNTHNCWKYLGGAAADARFLGLLEASAFIDRRAPPPTIFWPNDNQSFAPWLGVPLHEPFIKEPFIKEEMYQDLVRQRDRDRDQTAALLDDLDCETGETGRYEFPLLPYPYCRPPTLAGCAIEIWVEKSTVNDVLLPLARSLNLTLVTGVGELSVTACHALVRRVAQHRRATTVLYVSDHDPSGFGMPTSVGRKIQYFLHRECADLDITLSPVVLTAEQVAEYELPRVPIKESDRRRGKFEARFGEGATELDALQAIHPVELERIVRRAVDRCRAPTRRAAAENTRLAACIRGDIDRIRESVLSGHAEEIGDLRASFELAQSDIAEQQEAIAEKQMAIRQRVADARRDVEQVVADARRDVEEHRQTIAEHRQATVGRLGRWREEALPLWQTIAAEIEDALPDLDAIEWAQIERPDDALFDSRRSYLDQVAHFKRRQNGNGRARP